MNDVAIVIMVLILVIGIFPQLLISLANPAAMAMVKLF